MTAAKKRAIIRNVSASIELRQWCIEHAMRWPVMQTQTYSQAGGYLGGGGSTTTYSDADVIGRANKLLDWLTK